MEVAGSVRWLLRVGVMVQGKRGAFLSENGNEADQEHEIKMTSWSHQKHSSIEATFQFGGGRWRGGQKHDRPFE